MATISNPRAGVSPYYAAPAEPTVLATTANGRPSVTVNGQAALNSLITTSQIGVFQGANVTINLEEQNFNTTNQVTSNTNYPSGNTGEIQYNSGANSFASDPYFTYTNSNVVTPGIRTNNYLYGNGAPFIGGGNAAIGNFVFSGDIMTISDANQVMSITGNGTGNIQVTSNGNTWTFNNVGNLILPSNTSGINYANGVPYVVNYSNSNVSSFLAAFGSNPVSTTGNISAGYFIGNGSQLTNITSSYGNANVVANLAALGSNPVSSTGNITAGNILTSGLISVTGNVTAGNLDAVNLVINSIRSDDSTFVTIEDGVNITSGLISAPGSMLLTAGAQTFILDTNGILTLPGNSRVTPVGANIELQAAAGGYAEIVTSDGNNYVAVTTGGAEIVTSGVYTWTFGTDGNLSAPGNISAVNLVINSIRSDDSSFVTVEDGVNVHGEISATGNITGNYFIGNGSQLTGLPAPVVTQDITSNGAMSIMTYDGVIKYVNYATVEASSGNITGGNILTPGLISATGNITGGNLSAINLVINSIRSDDSTFVTIEDGVNVTSGSISAPENLSLTANAQTWTFRNDGIGIVLPYSATIRDTNNGALAIGYQAGFLTQGNTALAIGYQAAVYSQGANAVAIGFQSGGYVSSQGTSAVAVGASAGQAAQGNFAVAIGHTAGANAQGQYAVAVGNSAGLNNQGTYSVAIGLDAGTNTQGAFSVAVGYAAGFTTQANSTVAIGPFAGATSQGLNAVAIGVQSGYESQGLQAVAIGILAGANVQGNNSVAIGWNAGYESQGSQAVAIGLYAGNISQGDSAVAIGDNAGAISQGEDAVAIGILAGETSQGNAAVAVGPEAGVTTQGNNAVAIGHWAGQSGQGIQAVAIGFSAGRTSQGNNSIILNATGANLNQTTANTFTVAPVRNDVANIGNVMFYNATSKEITYGNVISVAGNITGNYFIGNGSQLTSVAVPSQTILPTIQSITAVARSAGLFGGGQGGANVTVANTIPVTEYGVIITAGTISETYKTGALGSIPGTVSLTFTTDLDSTQYTLFAYVTSNAGTYYSNAVTGTSGICLLVGTQIALSDGTRKAIEDITYTDKLLSWDFDRGCYAETTAMWIKRSETGSQYNLLTFSDGTTLRTFDQHRIFNKQAGSFTYPMTAATPVGTITVNEHGQEITLTNKQVIRDTIEYYNVITDYHMNLFSDSVLTSCRFNNIYPIVDMKFAKDGRTLRTRAEFVNVEDRFFHGLRLAEQTVGIETVEWYVNRLLSTEVSTHAELAV